MPTKNCLKLCLRAFVLALTLSFVGCGGSWWQNWKNNPVAQVQTFEQSARTVLAIADVSWNSVKPYLPAEVLIKAQPRYDQAVLAVNKALVLLDDAVQVAVETQNPHPDFSKLIAAVSDAVTQVVAIINEFKTTPTPATVSSTTPPKPTTPTGYDDLVNAAGTMKRIGGVK